MIRKMSFLCMLGFMTLFLVTSPISACTVLTSSSENTVLFGYNEDSERDIIDPDFDTSVYFHPASQDTYGYMDVQVTKSGFLSIRVGMNAEGLAMSGNGVPVTAMNSHPEKPYQTSIHSIFQVILEKASNVSEAIQIAKDFDFSPSLAAQIHIADASGDAVVFSPGLDGEIIFTRKNGSYLVSTNENIANDKQDLRYHRVTNMLDKGDEPTVDGMVSILDRVHWEGFETATYYSSIFDLQNRIAYFYHYHNYKEVAILNLMDELSEGAHQYVLSDLFSQEVVSKAENEYKMYEERVQITRIITAILLVIIIIILGLQILKTVKNSNLNSKKKIKKISAKTGLSLVGIISLQLTAEVMVYLVGGNYITSGNSDPLVRFLRVFLLYWLALGVSSTIYLIWRKYRSIKNNKINEYQSGLLA